MTFPYPFIWCPMCGEQIRFPYPTLQEPTSNQSRLPTDSWHITLLCFRCGRWLSVRAQDVQMTPAHRGVHNRRHWTPSFFRVECECGQTGCESPLTVFLSTTTLIAPSSIDRAERERQLKG